MLDELEAKQNSLKKSKEVISKSKKDVKVIADELKEN